MNCDMRMDRAASREAEGLAAESGLPTGVPSLAAQATPSRMRLWHLKWLTIVLPILFMAAIQACSMVFLEPSLGDASGHWVAVGILAAGVIVFSTTVFRILAAMQRRIVRQNEELSALNAVARAVSGSLDLREAITRALDNVVEVTQAVAGEIIVEGAGADGGDLRIASGGPDRLAELEALKARIERESKGTGSGNGVRIVDVETVERPAVSAPKRQTYACVPLKAQNQQFGVMRLVSTEVGHLRSEGSETLLANMGSQIAVAIQANHLFSDVLSRGKESQALYEIGLDITSMQDIRNILRSIVVHAREVMGSEAAALCLACPEGDLALAGYSGPREASGGVQTRVPVFTDALVTMSDDLIRQASSGTCETLGGRDVAGHLSAPLVVGASPIGELCVSGTPNRGFSERQRELLAALADMAAIAINNARLVERERYVAVLEERENLAREMHDSLAQVLGYLHLRAQTVKRTLAQRDIDKAGVELDEMASMAHEAYIDVREAILGLRETVSPAMGIAGTLKEYLHKFSRQAGVETDLEVEGDFVAQFPPEVEVQLVRVIQEALTNVRKHASASRALVRIRRTDGATVITVEDDGKGFDPESPGREDMHSFGMRSMRERVEKVGGRFEIESVPGHGATVRVTLPSAQGGDDGFAATD